MDRRKFIKRASAAAAGSFVLPYILPSGRLFAASGGGGAAQHVVFVLFAGGVRQQESILQRYLADSQNDPNEGNVMYAVAAVVSATVPLFLLVLFFQRQIVSGLTAGAVKG